MDTRELKGLFEAYQQVHTTIDEAVKGQDTEERREASRERRRGDKRLSKSAGKANADKMERDIKFYDKVTKKTRPSVVGMTHEELDIFDIVLEFLQVEGYAETLEEAEWLMANELDNEDISNILEVLDTPEKANEYAKKNVRSMLGAFAKGVVNKDMNQMKTIKKRTEGAKRAKRKAERKAAEEN